MNLSKLVSILFPLTITLAACGAPVTNVTVELDDAGHLLPSPDDNKSDAMAPTAPPPETVVVKVEYPDATPTTKVVIEVADAAGKTASPPASDAAAIITCPDVTTCGTVLGPTALVCLANIDICYAMKSTANPIDDTDNRYDACVDLCQATMLQCEAQFVNPDGTIIGVGDAGYGVENETNAFGMCGETYTGCCNGCEA
jgi:hypothetical protein